ncbi:MAG: DUF2384 domain-containing protein [Candidatus Competibacteraceae bacterium]|nr:DUF2384 domain-containing protein [Candidatus Competibacteraceae bacterium]
MTQTINRSKTKESVALRAFFNIGEQWELTTKQQMKLLGMTNQSTFYSYKNAPESARIDQDMLERISYILGIYQDLRTLLSNEDSVRSWIKKPNNAELFGGKSALDYLTNEGRMLDLYTVRQYLAANRGV